MELAEIKSLHEKLKDNISTIIKGKDEVINRVIICLFCSGHILLEDIPGTGKTTLAKALAKSVDCKFKRVQFTPDLLPTDLTGVNFYNQKEQKFTFKAGSIFTNVLLGDEINRATPRTQSSLLECMEEGQVSVDGQTYTLEQPFLVIATQNPIETQGTFPLPEAQLDRFFMKLSMGYPDPQNELEMLESFTLQNPIGALNSVISHNEVIEVQAAVRKITVGKAVKQYLLSIVNATRNHDKIRLGVSPRGSLALMRAAQAVAAINGRDYVIPDDVKDMCADVLAHRIICKGHSMSQSSGAAREYIHQILVEVAVPVL